MLTHRTVPDPKCKLIISTFLTIPHLLACLICTRNSMSIVLLFQIMGGWHGVGRWGGGLIFIFILGCGYHIIVFAFVLCFCILLSVFLSPFL